jgi:hypothetical protein
MRFRSKITPAQLRQKLIDLNLSQSQFARMTFLPREGINKACNARTHIPRDIALGLRLAEITIALRAIVNNHHRRPGWRNINAVLAIAEDPIVLQKRKPGRKGGRYKPRQPKITPPIQPVIPPSSSLPVAPHGFYYAHVGYNLVLRRHRNVPDGVI